MTIIPLWPRDPSIPTDLFILVFVASPLDYARYRHTALYFELDTSSAANDADADSLVDAEVGSGSGSGSVMPTPPRFNPIKFAVVEVVGATDDGRG